MDYIDSTLRKQGYRKLGSGIDQTAYKVPSENRVIKIVTESARRGRGLTPEQKMIERWVKWCMKNSDNPFLPKYHGVAYFDNPEDGSVYTQVSTERLFSFNRDTRKKALMRCVGGFDSTKIDLNMAYTIFGDKAEMFYGTMEKIFGMASRHGYGLDLHEGNYMIRKDGQIVINDPFTV